MDYLDKEGIVFDAFYQRLKALKRTDEYCNYNQVYLDFEVCTAVRKATDSSEGSDNNNSGITQVPSVQHSVLVVAPICLENEDIKDKDGE